MLIMRTNKGFLYQGVPVRVWEGWIGGEPVVALVAKIRTDREIPWDLPPWPSDTLPDYPENASKMTLAQLKEAAGP